VLDFAASPDETRVLSVSYELDPETSQPVTGTERATVWGVASGEPLQTVAFPELTQGRWTPDGEQVIVWGNAGGALVDAASGEVVLRFREGDFVRNVALSPGGERLLVWGGAQLDVWAR
jgi:hypothetical protein